jgi:hypothetical protein
MTLLSARAAFRRAHPNLRTDGWDTRDYELWSAVNQLPSYGLIAPDDVMVSRKQVIELIKKAAEERFEQEWKEKGR